MYLNVILILAVIILTAVFLKENKKKRKTFIAFSLVIVLLCTASLIADAHGFIITDDAVSKDAKEYSVAYKTVSGEKLHLTDECGYLANSKKVLLTDARNADYADICSRCKSRIK